MTWKVTVVSNTIKYKEWNVKEGTWERHNNYRRPIARISKRCQINYFN
jgi:hypothetical protein